MLLQFKKILFRYKLEIILIFIVASLFFSLRLYQLQRIPIFVDEAIYAEWAQAGKYNPLLRMVSLVDGKQPLYIWLISIAMNFIYNPIIAGRLVSVLAGFITVIGLFLLSYELFKNRWISLLSAFLYVLYPFALLTNRMGTYESLVGMLSVLSLYLALLMLRFLSLGSALSLGFVLGASLLTKSSGVINMYLIPTILVLGIKRKKNPTIVRWIALYGIACICALLYGSVLFLSDMRYMIAEKDAIFIYHLKELMPYGAFGKWPGNLFLLLEWTATYLTYPILLIIFFSFTTKTHWKEKLLLLLWFSPIIGLALFGRQLNPRYIFPLSLFLLPLAAVGLWELFNLLKNKLVFGLILIVCISFLGFSNYKIVTNLATAPIPHEDKNQYINGPSAGVGLREMVRYLQQEAEKNKIVIATEGRYGSLPTTVINIYFVHHTQVERYSFPEKLEKIPKEFLVMSESKPVYIIFNETQDITKFPVVPIMQFKRGISNYSIGLYKIEKIQKMIDEKNTEL